MSNSACHQLFVYFSLVFLLGAQSKDKQIIGVVLDLQTLEPIPFVTIISLRSGAVTNSEGAFNVIVQENDSLIFSHVNYEKWVVSINSLSDSVNTVYLNPITIKLKEIIITDIPTEEEFIEQVLEYRVEPSAYEEIASFNFQNARYIYLSDWKPEMDSKDNYRAYLQGPQPFTFFSTNPKRGIMSLFRKKHPLPRLQFNQEYVPPKDSLKF